MIIEKQNGFAVRVYRGKHRGYEWVGTFKFKDHGGKRGARRAAKAAEEAAKVGAPGQRALKIGDYVKRYLDEYEETRKDSSFVTMRSQLKQFTRDFGDRNLVNDAITRREAIEWSHEHRWCVPAVVTLLNRAKADEEINRNAFAGLSRKGRGRKDKVPLSRDELDQLASLALRLHADYGPTVKALILLAAYTGLRPGELFALEWSDIDFDAMRVHVHRRVYKGRTALPKNNRVRMIVLTPEAKAVLAGLERDGELVFRAKRGGRMSQSMLTILWTPIAAALGRRADRNGRREFVAVYELRHRAAHWMYVELGMHERLVAVQLGHTDGGKLVRELYGHGDHGALEEIDRYFAATSAPRLRAV
jgi:integrase